jgi:hypothetical protein
MFDPRHCGAMIVERKSGVAIAACQLRIFFGFRSPPNHQSAAPIHVRRTSVVAVVKDKLSYHVSH